MQHLKYWLFGLELICTCFGLISHSSTILADSIGEEDPNQVDFSDNDLAQLPPDFQPLANLNNAHEVSPTSAPIADDTYTFRPTFTQQTQTDFTADPDTAAQISEVFNDPQMNGKPYLKLTAQNQATKLGATTTFTHVGTFRGQDLDLKIHSTFNLPGTSSERYGAIGIASNDFLNVHLRARGLGWSATNQIRFYKTGTNQLVNVQGYWNFLGINKAKVLNIDSDALDNQQDQLYYPANSTFGYRHLAGQSYQFMSQEKAGKMDNPLTLRYRSTPDTSFTYSFADPTGKEERASVGIDYTNQNLFSYAPPKPNKTGLTASDFSAPNNALYRVQQNIPNAATVAKAYSSFQIQDQLNSHLIIDQQNTRVVDQNDHVVSGAGKLFNLTFGPHNQITATADPTALQNLTDTSQANYFYANTYVLKIYGQLDPNQALDDLTSSVGTDQNTYYDVPNTAQVLLNQNATATPQATAQVLSPNNWWYIKDQTLYIRDNAVGKYAGMPPWSPQSYNVTQVHFGQNVTLNNTQQFLAQMPQLTTVTLPSDLNTSQATNFSQFFSGDNHLEQINGLDHLNFSQATNMAGMFAQTDLSTLTLPNNFQQATQVTNFDDFLTNNPQLTLLNLATLKMNPASTTVDFFANDTGLASLTLGVDNNFLPNAQTNLAALPQDDQAGSLQGKTGKWLHLASEQTYHSNELIAQYQSDNPQHSKQAATYVPQVGNLLYLTQIPNNLTFGPIIADSSLLTKQLEPNQHPQQNVSVTDLHASSIQGQNWNVLITATAFTPSAQGLQLQLNHQNLTTDQPYELNPRKQTIHNQQFTWDLTANSQTGFTLQYVPATLTGGHYQATIQYTINNSLN